MSYRAVLFDLDGTLLDTLSDLADAANQTLAALDLPEHPEEQYRWFVGDGLLALMARMLPESQRTPEDIERAAQIFREKYRHCHNNKTRPYPGIQAMLATLSRDNFPLTVLSNKPHAFTLICVQQYFGDQVFCQVLGQRDNVPKKPDPAGAFEIAAALGLDPASILYVGDSSTDMQTATAAGMDAVGVLWGFRDKAELIENGARYLVHHPEELAALVQTGSTVEPRS
ncbi:MAG: HAD family hydrolase [Desulfobulbus propionicus]|nr:MAG: HAD family hydrolase [Desulfobulbus propionicus]